MKHVVQEIHCRRFRKYDFDKLLQRVLESGIGLLKSTKKTFDIASSGIFCRFRPDFSFKMRFVFSMGIFCIVF